MSKLDPRCLHVAMEIADLDETPPVHMQRLMAVLAESMCLDGAQAIVAVMSLGIRLVTSAQEKNPNLSADKLHGLDVAIAFQELLNAMTIQHAESGQGFRPSGESQLVEVVKH